MSYDPLNTPNHPDAAHPASAGTAPHPGTPNPPDSAPEAPHLDFAGSTPYEDYVHADVLTHLQELRSEDPGEMVFLVTTQVMELWFTVLVHEWETAARALREDELPRALDALRRSRRELDALNASWLPLAGLTPAQFNSYRGALGEGSGFQSAMYRRLEFLLGEKSAAMLVPHKGHGARARRAGEGAPRARSLRRGAALPRPARPPRAALRARPRPEPPLRAVRAGRGGVGGDLPR
ncbi:tryptophan 2,3-dioxygenase [Streptomyces sp. SPB78]|nr:tryptophan 2,3-dioxygenase [Streptomyces sp. SPB78]